MIPPPFDYSRPQTLSEAVALLQQRGDTAKILSGGQSLIPMMKMRVARPEYLIDINQIPDLRYVREDDGYLKIGGLTRQADLENSELICSKYPIILDTASLIGDPQVRNLATVGGNLAHGDPGNDHPATMLALEAEVIAVGPHGKRSIPVKEFFLGFFSTALEHDEILTEIRLPIPGPKSGGAYFKLERKVGDFAAVGVAAQVTLDDEGACRRVGVGLTNVGATSIKANNAEDFLRDKALDQSNIGRTAELAAEAAQPSSDLRGPAEYKVAMVRELTKRALTRAGQRASSS